jgi:AraC-like DNA-binding protein
LTYPDIDLTIFHMPESSTHYLARSAALHGFGEVLAGLGHDPHKLVRMAGLPPAFLTEPEFRIPTLAMLKILEIAVEQTGIEDLGLRMAANRPYSSLGAFGLLLREQATVRDMLTTMITNIWIQIEGLTFSLEEDDGLAIFTIEFDQTHGLRVQQAIELIAANVVQRLKQVLGPYWKPEMLLFRHAKPSGLARHLDSFQCVPLFSHDRNAVVLLSRDLDTPIPQADPAAAEHLARYLAMIAGSRHQDFPSKVRQLVTAMLPQGLSRMDRIARQLNMQPRTLHRRLEQEGTSFGELLTSVRTELLQAYLTSDKRSLTEISELLGFSSLSAFSRWKRGLSESVK